MTFEQKLEGSGGASQAEEITSAQSTDEICQLCLRKSTKNTGVARIIEVETPVREVIGTQIMKNLMHHC